ncbi:hypothetical protein [Nocardia nova]|uniref:hypothetical protein n=1 Tax=Nocardia nova TaxID=37330 RepID=UPI000B1D98D1|nr:hypothetical protein [Nocardia nova]
MTTADVPATVPEPQEYPWRLAPAHLKTRRQLRAAGLQPNRQPVAALMIGRRRGRRLVAHLFDIGKAAPKKPPTPAQLAAAANAVREHQARAAERRGIARDALTRTDNPGPGWDSTPETTLQEGNTMSTTTNHTAQPQLGVPTGHSQRMIHLLAVAGVNQARHAVKERDIEAAGARNAGPDAYAEFETRSTRARVAAEERLETSAPWVNRWRLTASLADALTWRWESEIAAEHLTELTRGVAEQWGVRIDADAMQVSVDPQFDPIPQQTRDEASVLFARESAAIDAVSKIPMNENTKAAVAQAVLNWRGEDIDTDPAGHLASVAERRAGLTAALDTAGVTGADRERVEFVVDYLGGDTSAVDLLRSPVYVDPGEEVRGRAQEMLKGLSEGTFQPQRITEEISVMTAADQQTVRDAWTAFRNGQRDNLDVWPGYVNRDALTADIYRFVIDADDLSQAADFIVDDDISGNSPEMIGVSDDIGAQIERLAYTGDQLLAQATNGKGLAAIEKAQIAALVDDVDTGRIRNLTDLPDLLLVDERSKRERDQARIAVPARELADTMKTQVTELLEPTGVTADHRDMKARHAIQAVDNVADSVRAVARGATTFGIDHERREYAQRRNELDKALTAVGADEQLRGQIRRAVDAGAREAGHLGRDAAERDQHWNTKFERITMMRDDAARTAAASPSRACTTRPDKSINQARAAAPARVGGRRNLRDAGAER